MTLDDVQEHFDRVTRLHQMQGLDKSKAGKVVEFTYLEMEAALQAATASHHDALIKKVIGAPIYGGQDA